MSTLLTLVGIFVALALLGALLEVVSKGLDAMARFTANHFSERDVERFETPTVLVAFFAVIGGLVLIASSHDSISLLLFYSTLSSIAFAVVAAIVVARAGRVHADRSSERSEELRLQEWNRMAPERERAREEYEQKQRTFEHIKALSGRDFERHVEGTYRKLGYQVQRIGGSGDQGVDHIIRKGGIKIAVQCKRYSGVVGNAAVQEAISGKLFHGCGHAVVVTTSTFTKAAKELARRGDVQLIDGLAYMTMVESPVTGPSEIISS